MKKILYTIILFSILVPSCRKAEKLSLAQRDKASVVLDGDFQKTDALINKDFVSPYNISVVYKAEPYKDPYFPNNSLADVKKVYEALKALHEIWFVGLKEYTDTAFVAKVAPAQIRVYGSPNYNAIGIEEIDTKQSAMTASLFNINAFDPSSAKQVYRLSRTYAYNMAKRMLELHPADLETFGKLNFVSYAKALSKLNLTPGQYEESSQNSINLGYLSYGAEKDALNDFAETFSYIICNSSKDLEDLLSSVKPERIRLTPGVDFDMDNIPGYTVNDYFGSGEIPIYIKKETVNLIKNSVRAKIAFIDSYLLNNFGIKRNVQLTRYMSQFVKAYPTKNNEEK